MVAKGGGIKVKEFTDTVSKILHKKIMFFPESVFANPTAVSVRHFG
jgi:hypothetical protein